MIKTQHPSYANKNTLIKNPVVSKRILSGEFLPESIGDVQVDDELVTVVLRLSEQGMCVVQRPNGCLMEVCDDCF